VTSQEKNKKGGNSENSIKIWFQLLFNFELCMLNVEGRSGRDSMIV